MSVRLESVFGWFRYPRMQVNDPDCLSVSHFYLRSKTQRAVGVCATCQNLHSHSLLPTEPDDCLGPVQTPTYPPHVLRQRMVAPQHFADCRLHS